jgi:hypothetical protein
VYNRLKRSGILDEYIIPSYDVLHTFSLPYLLDDLQECMKEKGVLQSVKPTTTMNQSEATLASMRYTHIIASIAEMYNVPVEEAMNIFYNSKMFPLIEDKVADLHCRSEKYLASLVWDERLN